MPTPSAKSAKGAAISFTKSQAEKIMTAVRELKCPQCKAYALFFTEERGETVVRCRKCAFVESLSRFSLTRLGYAVTEGRPSVRYLDCFGDEKLVYLDEN